MSHKLTFDLTLHEAVAVLVYRHSKTVMPQTNYRILCEWLGVHSYIIPVDRHLNESALCLPILNKSDLFANWHYCNLLETHYTSAQQSNIIRHILCNPPPRYLR